MKDKARAIIGFVEDACSEAGYGLWKDYQDRGYKHYDEDIEGHIKKKQLAGVKDIPGSLADDFYNDPKFCEDMLGDRIYGDCEGKDKDIVRLAEEVKEQSTCQAMKTACDEIIRRWTS